MSKPLIIQSDNTLLLEVDNPDFENARDSIAQFSELVKSPEHIHTYKVSPLSLWNAAASGLSYQDIINILKHYSRYDIPDIVNTTIKDQMRRYGLLKLVPQDTDIFLVSSDAILLNEICNTKKIQQFIDARIDDNRIKIRKNYRGHIKQALIKIGFPVEDLAGYEDGDPCNITLKDVSLKGQTFRIRDYQQSSVNAFYRGGGPEGGSGIVVLPCGAGKTIVGIAIMNLLSTETLILVTNTIALRQWKEELLDKTYLEADQIGEFSGEKKEIRPITIATYNILTYRKDKNGPFLHFDLFNSKNWGLIIYDEVHLLPAPVFRMTSEIQSKRRLGLTATLIREDGMEADVFSLIGPKKFDMPWKTLEKSNWIAKALCTEVRIDLPDDLRMKYSLAKDREKFRIASENHEKNKIVGTIIEHHGNSNILIIGQYISQLKEIADHFKFPMITGSTSITEREELYRLFKEETIKILVVSKVANFSIDLPDANVAIQISGTFGSRQEEAQRLGRILRPKKGDNKAYFYTIITSNSVEEKFAHNRQLFLTEQGYTYIILNKEMFHEKFK
ncbi:MAG TPA: DEAD/DEAH box helicase [Spirochaetota bacterium]|nr:DEAD/DEAH box helicase [Spirochaetota bacterium]HPC39459.1 DEAD/DEAH box helicase [Spirochaetota bacterium]HQF06796.1 DEAD/DEAH box helicase [Spirochaetota bacterium]HQH95585.1 DEAD/DEAH box helicase [Spirochaetota bacterium]HQJ69163.1 DEAD/DEAH box helicase [Spirochaetota bacterium]